MPDDYGARNNQADIERHATPSSPDQTQPISQTAEEPGIPYSAYAEEFNDTRGLGERRHQFKQSIEQTTSDNDDSQLV